LLIRQKEDQVRFSLRDHGLSGPALNQPWRPAAIVELGGSRELSRLGNRRTENLWRRNMCNSSVSWSA
jgi:hypothetical protein